MERLTIDDMKSIELEIMDEIDRVCQAHGVQYFLGYGSLLGAVRHGGFIPWDDDMDIIMMRDQYELLMANFNEWRTTERFKLVSYRDKSSIYPIAKIVDTSTVVYESFVGKRASTGVWVDVFPLERFEPSSKPLLRKRHLVGLIRDFAITDPSTGSNWAVKLIKRIVCPFLKDKDPYVLAGKLDQIAQQVNAQGAKSDRLIPVLGEGRASRNYPTSYFKPMFVQFEDRVFPAPSCFDEYLTIEYGDWKTLPPESSRLAHVTEAYRL